jgi:hypothetical protein
MSGRYLRPKRRFQIVDDAGQIHNNDKYAIIGGLAGITAILVAVILAIVTSKQTQSGFILAYKRPYPEAGSKIGFQLHNIKFTTNLLRI